MVHNCNSDNEYRNKFRFGPTAGNDKADQFRGADVIPIRGLSDESVIPFCVPYYHIEALAGYGDLVEDVSPASCLIVSSHWLRCFVRDVTKVFAFEAGGDCMEPTVCDGDLLLAEANFDADLISAGGVFVLAVAGLAMIKRVKGPIDGDLKVLSDNPDYKPEIIPAAERADKIIIHGRVFWAGGQLSGRGT